MGKPEWGAKRICPNCGARFYDLLRDPVPCPSCGTAFELDSLSERKTTQTVRAKAKPEKAAETPAEPETEEDADLLDDDAPDTVSEDVLLAEEEDDDSDDLGDIEVTKDDDDET
jgi:uncharacterized protein (TIGR02300 family)